MKMKPSLLVFFSSLLLVEIQAIRKQEIHITYPERLDTHRSKRDLSTAIDGDHESSASFNVNNWVLDTKRNNELAPKTVTVRQFLADNTEVLHEDTPNNCHYQGSIRGVPDSTVVLNTCDGLRGIIDDGKQTFHIEPHDEQKDTGAHKLYLANNDEEFDATKNCGTHNDEHFHKASDDESKLSATIKRIRHSVVDMEDKYRPYLTTDETRYNEVLFVVDNKIYQGYQNNTKTVIDKVLTLCNAVDAIYQRINVRVVMTAIEIWTNGDRFERQTSGGAALGKFQDYRQRELMNKIPHDNGQFLSNHGWSGGVIGMAWVGTMCNRLSAGVNTWSFGSIIGPYVTVAHEMGHNFGYPHDSGNCKCLTPKGCFMGGHKTRVPGFSNCSLTKMRRINDRCLYNKPVVLRPQCGNGIQEGDEECDCGTPEMCKAKDPCCQPHDCKLKPSAICSDLHHSCCKDCQYKRQGTLCRPAETDCDVPEYCPGDSRDCPANSYMQNGTPCNQTQKLFVGNTNRNSVVMRSLSPRIEARYVRIKARYWHWWVCMRAELYGCSANEVNPTSPSPIKPYNDYCVVPKNKTLIPHEKSRIVFKWGRICKQKYMDFRLDANGILWHHSSGRRVCPDGGTWNGAKLVISSTCTDEDSKFIRTSKHSLKHVKTGKCVHPNGGWPGNNVELHIWNGCDETRLQLFFMKPDCFVPLGLSTNELPDDQITASSSRRSSESAQFGRLHNNSYWCAAKKKNTEYLQIDLGKAQTINKIATQGRGNWHDWVTGYFLEYSQDGQRWTEYSEYGNSETSNSYCFSGKCPVTRATQCRDLWGPNSNDAKQGCYDKLNTEAKGFGTCDPASNSSCAASNVLCGQIQCLAKGNTPVVNYGKTYQKLTLEDSTQCSAAVMATNSDSLGLGMVTDGTKCGDQKMCSNYECKSFSELNIKSCPQANGKECNGQGVCTNKGVCHCDVGYDPDTACVKALVPRDGGYSSWSAWTMCNAGCNGGTRSRHRFCNNPFPQHGGKDCQGERKQQRDCNTDACPRAHSCRQLQKITAAENKLLPDGVYKIYPYGVDKDPITAYCDMSRDGGGWTLLVTSHTNSWTSQNVRLRNQNSPSLTNDYSVLKHADAIKNNLNVVGSKFEYRLEAQSRGRWGGIWEADRSYTFTATNNAQTNVQLIKKFDDWQYANSGIEKRMPWISGAKLTTSGNANSHWWGTITGNDKKYHPAPWIHGHLMEKQPEYIWYWVREGPWKLPRSCMEVQMRGLQTTPKKDGVYLIKPPGKKEVKTYCDLTSRGGGWTLLITSKTHSGWTVDNVKQRNAGNPSLDADYSILEFADDIKDFDDSQDFFQYRIEADGSNQYGGIFEAPREYTFTSTCDKQTNITMVENFNGLGKDTNLARRMPRLELSSKIFLSSGSAKDSSGSIVYNDGSDNAPSYLPNVKANPGVVRYWMREGTRRSCNDIKVHGTRLSKTYQDDYYMIRLVNDYTYFPVFCDMTSDLGAYTLIVTSRHNSWTRAQVPERNVYQPSISDDYSILKYADLIKNLGHNSTFKYKLDANERGHWGGVWSAPRDYSFMFTSNKQTGVTLLKKFDAWSFSWWKSVQNRMPWFDANGKSNKALLTTSGGTTYYPAGSIIWGDKDRHPAEWMRFGGMMNPGVIWYWVNEDDCDLDRQPVDGGLSNWGPWGKCDKLCANGKQTRRRTCTNPEPKCGGLPCSASEKTVEERHCYTCPESPIRSFGGYCIQPKSGDCNPKENMTTLSHSLIFRRADTNCSANYMKFLFDADGMIYHKCSGKIVCPNGNYVANGRKLLLKDECPRDVSMHRRLPSKSLQNKKNGYCVHPLNAWPRENGYLVYWAGCNAERLTFDFFNLPPP